MPSFIASTPADFLDVFVVTVGIAYLEYTDLQKKRKEKVDALTFSCTFSTRFILLLSSR